MPKASEGHRRLSKGTKDYRRLPNKLERDPKRLVVYSVNEAYTSSGSISFTLQLFLYMPRQKSPMGLIKHQPQGSPSAASPRSYFFTSPSPAGDNASAVEENREDWSPRVRSWMPAPASLSPMISENGMSLPGSPTPQGSRYGTAGRLVRQLQQYVIAIECAGFLTWD